METKMYKVEDSCIESVGFLQHPNCKRTWYERRGVLVVQFKNKHGKRTGLYYYQDVSKLSFIYIKKEGMYAFNRLVRPYCTYKRVDIAGLGWVRV